MKVFLFIKENSYYNNSFIYIYVYTRIQLVKSGHLYTSP